MEQSLPHSDADTPPHSWVALQAQHSCWVGSCHPPKSRVLTSPREAHQNHCRKCTDRVPMQGIERMPPQAHIAPGVGWVTTGGHGKGDS